MGIRREWVIGKHKANLETPDVLVVKMGGAVSGEDAKALISVFKEVASERPFFAVMEVPGFAANADARKVFTQELRQEWFRAMIFVGAGTVERAVTKAMTVALYLAGKWKTDFLYTDTTDQARTLISQIRTKENTAAV